MQTIQTQVLDLMQSWSDSDPTQAGKFDFPIHVGTGAMSSSLVYFEVQPGQHCGMHTHSATWLALRVEDMLESHAGEFLPEWDELELETTQGKSATSDVIREARRKVEDARAELLVALGDSYLARQEATMAVRYLEQALDRKPDSTTTALKLADACAQSGQGGYANQVRLRYGLEAGERPRPRP